MLKVFFVSTVLLFSSGTTVSAGQEARANGPAARLRADIRRAIENGNPTEDELATLQKSLATLKDARSAREQGRPVDRQAVENALAGAKKVFQSDSFRAADRKAVQHDIEEIRSRHER